MGKVQGGNWGLIKGRGDRGGCSRDWGLVARELHARPLPDSIFV